MIRLFVKINSTHGGVKVILKSHFISQEFWRTSEIYWSIELCTKLRESINVLHEWISIPNFFHIKARKFEARHFLFLHNFTFLSIFTSYSFHSKFQMFHSWIKNSLYKRSTFWNGSPVSQWSVIVQPYLTYSEVPNRRACSQSH